jgi:virulence factor Mce-like protein
VSEVGRSGGNGGAARGSGAADFEAGLAASRTGDLQAAESAFKRADAAGNPSAAACLGLILESRGDLAGAEAAYQRAASREDWFGAFRLGQLYAGRDDWDGAQRIWIQSEGYVRTDGPYELDELLLGDRVAEAGKTPGPSTPALLSPVLIGAITVLIALVATFLGYNANVGLPFVPVRTLHVDLSDGSDLVVGNDVLNGGYRIGYVSSMRPITLPTGAPAAQLTLALSTGQQGKIPVDSTATILSRSALGLKYLEITPGDSRRVFADGATMPITQTAVPVRLDQIFDGQPPQVRSAIQQDLLQSGDLFAGRGSAINDTLHALPTLLGNLTPVAKYLAAPSTNLTDFFNALDGFTKTVAPIAEDNVKLFGDLGTTLESISASNNALEETISRTASALAVGTRSLATQQPFLANLTTFGHEFSPATYALRTALPVLDPAIAAGAQTLKLTPPLDSDVNDVMQALKQLAQSPGTDIALNGLSATVHVLNPTVRYLGPFVTVCNDWNYWWTDLAGDVDEATDFGFAQRALFMLGNPAQTNNVGTLGATAPPDGGGAAYLPLVGGDEFDHSPDYGAAVESNGDADCETGQRGYPKKENHNDPEGRDFQTDSNGPTDLGTTFTGINHVPTGETFSRNPEIGPTAPTYPGSN